MIKAITFDLWDTIFVDDSDEPKRKAKGLSPKPLERQNIIARFIKEINPQPRNIIAAAYDSVDAAFRHVWYNQNVTWTVRERLEVLLKGLKCRMDEKKLIEMIRLHEEMELEVMPDLAPGILEMLETLSGKYRLGVISDAIFSPGRVLRKILEAYDLKRFFDSFIFSDEIGYAKPAPIVFEASAEALDVHLSEIIHVGDREEKDVDGPHAVGAKAVFTTVVKDRGSTDTKAEIICHNYSDFPVLIESLNQG